MERDLLGVTVEVVKGLPIVKVSGEATLKKDHIGFALDVMKDVQIFEEGSIGSQATMLLDLLQNFEVLKFHFQIFSVTEKQGILTSGRCELLSQKLSKMTRKAGLKLGGFWDQESALLKVGILPDRRLIVSLLLPERRSTFWHLISPFPGGYTTIEDDKAAPSRAFKKLVESQLILGSKIKAGESLLDLGACPGGWSYVALKAQAMVTAVDRSPVREDLIKHKGLQFQSGDAFKVDNSKSYDWVVSDIICAPDRILELIDSWVGSEKCTYFVFTIKLKRRDDYLFLKEMKEKLAQLNYHTILRQLNVNKNEVMVMGKKSMRGSAGTF